MCLLERIINGKGCKTGIEIRQYEPRWFLIEIMIKKNVTLKKKKTHKSTMND